MKRIVVISGLSGAGKSTALGFFEDSGFFCMDNVPSIILESIVGLLMSSPVERIAMVVDVRSEAFGDPSKVLKKLKEVHGEKFTIIFLEASIDSIVKRYALTRRKHPLMDQYVSVEEAIRREKELLGEIRNIADFVVDTTNLNSHGLREKLQKLLETLEERVGRFTFRIESFGYKYGIPVDSDFVFDTRFFPNPYYDPKLSEKTGLDPEVEEFFSKFPEMEEYVENVLRIILKAKEGYAREGRNTLSVAIGCTGGRHRSVYIARKLSEKLKELGEKVSLDHRDVNRS